MRQYRVTLSTNDPRATISFALCLNIDPNKTELTPSYMLFVLNKTGSLAPIRLILYIKLISEHSDNECKGFNMSHVLCFEINIVMRNEQRLLFYYLKYNFIVNECS